MCECCEADTLDYEFLLPNIGLVKARKDSRLMKAGQYALTRHSYPFLVFDYDLSPEPDIEVVSIQEWSEWADKWYKIDEQDMRADEGYALMKDMIDLGYNPKEDGRFACWLLPKIAEAVAKGPIDYDAMEQPEITEDK